MKVPRATGILSVVLASLSFLNFVLKSYTYFVLIVASARHNGGGPPVVHSGEGGEANGQTSMLSSSGTITQETGDEAHPHLMFVPLLTFIPTRSPVLSRPWVFLTSGLVEDIGIWFISSLVLIFYLGKYIENLWGSRELTKFVIFVVVITNVLVYIFYGLKVCCISSHDYVPPLVQGVMPIVMGLFVAVKQRIANHYIILFQGNVRIKVTYIPFLTLVFTYALLYLDLDVNIIFTHSLASFVVSWTYLRFFKVGTNERQSYLLPFALSRKRSSRLKRQNVSEKLVNKVPSSTNGSQMSEISLDLDSTSTKGDRSLQFSFYTFFPYPLSSFIKIVCNLIFQVPVKYKLLDPNDFPDYDEEDGDDYSYEDVNNLQSGLFDLSPLKGVEDVSTLPLAKSKIENFLSWISGNSKPILQLGLKYNMDQRRKLALKELD